MKEERKVIETNAIVVFNGDVNASKLNELFQDFQGDVIINGSLLIDENLEIACNLYVVDDINSEYDKKIHIAGNLYCDGDVDCYDIYVEESFFCTSINSCNINVVEDFCCEDDIEAYGYDINVGGDFFCKGKVEADFVNIYKIMHLSGEIQVREIAVGY